MNLNTAGTYYPTQQIGMGRVQLPSQLFSSMPPTSNMPFDRHKQPPIHAKGFAHIVQSHIDQSSSQGDREGKKRADLSMSIASSEKQPSPVTEHRPIPITSSEKQPSLVVKHSPIPITLLEKSHSPVVKHSPVLSALLEKSRSPGVKHSPVLSALLEKSPDSGEFAIESAMLTKLEDYISMFLEFKYDETIGGIPIDDERQKKLDMAQTNLVTFHAKHGDVLDKAILDRAIEICEINFFKEILPRLRNIDVDNVDELHEILSKISASMKFDLRKLEHNMMISSLEWVSSSPTVELGIKIEKLKQEQELFIRQVNFIDNWEFKYKKELFSDITSGVDDPTSPIRSLNDIQMGREVE